MCVFLVFHFLFLDVFVFHVFDLFFVQHKRSETAREVSAVNGFIQKTKRNRPPPSPPPTQPPSPHPCPVSRAGVGWGGMRGRGGGGRGRGRGEGEEGRGCVGGWCGRGLTHLTQPKPTDLSGGSTTSAAYSRGISRIWTKSKLAKFRV